MYALALFFLSGAMHAVGRGYVILFCIAVSRGKLCKRSQASIADWEDEDLGQDAVDALECPADDDNVSTVRTSKCNSSNMRNHAYNCKAVLLRSFSRIPCGVLNSLCCHVKHA